MPNTRLGAVALLLLLVGDLTFTKVECVEPVGVVAAVATASTAVNSLYFGLRNVAKVISRLSTLRGEGPRNHKILTARDMEYLNLLQLRNGVLADKEKCSKSYGDTVGESEVKTIEGKYDSILDDLDSLITGRVNSFQRLVSPVPVWALVEASLLVCLTTLGETRVLLLRCERNSKCQRLLSIVGKTGSSGGFSLEKAEKQFDDIVQYWEHNLEKQGDSISGKVKTKLWDLRAKLRGIEGGTWSEKNVFEQARAILISNDQAFPKNMHLHIETLQGMLATLVNELHTFLGERSHPSAVGLEDDDDDDAVGAEGVPESSPSAMTLRSEDNIEPLSDDSKSENPSSPTSPDHESADNDPAANDESTIFDYFGGTDDDSFFREDDSSRPLLGSYLSFLQTREGVKNSDLTELASSGPTIFKSLYAVFNDFKRLLSSSSDYYGMLNSIKTVSSGVKNLESQWASLFMCTDFLTSTFAYMESSHEEERDVAEMRLRALKNMSYYLKITRNRLKSLGSKLMSRFAAEQSGIWDMHDTVTMFMALLNSWQSTSRIDRGCAILYTGVGKSYLEAVLEKDHTMVCTKDSAEEDVHIEDAHRRDRDLGNLSDRYNNFVRSQFTVDVVSMYQPQNRYTQLPDKYIRLDRFGERTKRLDCIPEEEFATMCARPGFIMSIRYQPEVVGDEGDLAPTSFYFRVPMIESKEEIHQPYDDQGVTDHICNMLQWQTGKDSREAKACRGDDGYEWITESIFRKGRKEYYTDATRGDTIQTKSAWYHARAYSHSRDSVVSDDDSTLKYFYVSDFEGDGKTLREPDANVFFLRVRIVEKEVTDDNIEERPTE